MKNKTKPKPAVQAAPPPALPESLQRALAAEAKKAVEEGFASRPNPPADGPLTSGARDLQLDLSEDTRQKRRYAALGLRMKEAYLKQAKHFGRTEDSYKRLEGFIERTKAVGQFAGIFEQGGAFTRETVTSEVVELARPNSILLNAGIRTISGYGARLTMGTIDEGVTVYWVAEGQPPVPSMVKDGTLVLSAHKLMALARISNDLLRLSAIDAAAIIGEDMAAAMGLEIDVAGFKAKGPKRPNGLRTQMDPAARAASAGTNTPSMIKDTDGVMGAVAKANIPGGLKSNGGFYYSSTDIYLALRQARDNAGWVFPDLRSDTPTLNGFPYFFSETLADDDKALGFGLAKQFIMGEATPLETSMGENGTDFAADMVTMRAVTEVDFLLRYRKAFAERTGVNY